MNTTVRPDLSEEEREKLVESIRTVMSENDNSIPIIGLPRNGDWGRPKVIELSDRPPKHGTRLHRLAFEHDLSIMWDEVR